MFDHLNFDHFRGDCRVAVIWIDWYPYHVARFRGLDSDPSFAGHCYGLELVGGIGVHAGLKFREELPADLPIETLLPDVSWGEASRLKLARLVWQRLSRHAPRVVLVPGYYTLPAIAAALWARLHGATSVLMTESTAYDHERVDWKELVKSVGMRILFSWAIAGGKAHLDYLQQLGFPSDRITDSYDVVDNEMFSHGTAFLRQKTAKEFCLPELPFFVYVGRLAPEKNVAMLLESWIAYRKQGGCWPLILVGNGPEASALKSAAAASRYAADVIFAGLKSSYELLPYYAFAGAFVLPSTREPWGLVVNEAMAAALPVLVSERCGSAHDLVAEGVNGYVFSPHDQDGLTALLTHMEVMPSDQRVQMGARSQEMIRNYSPEGFARSVAVIADAMDATPMLRPATGGSR